MAVAVPKLWCERLSMFMVLVYIALNVPWHWYAWLSMFPGTSMNSCHCFLVLVALVPFYRYDWFCIFPCSDLKDF